MKEKFFNFLKELRGSSYLEYYITYLISPMLTGVKPASIINIGENEKELLKIWRKIGTILLASLNLESIILKRTDNADVVLIYNRENLLNMLNCLNNKSFLESIGYEHLDNLDVTLSYLHKRYNIYHCPHEIGIFLGIPLDDVKAFINCSSHKCLLCGYWKVYSNEEKAKSLFTKYDWSKEKVMTYSLEGKSALWIADNLKNTFAYANN